MSQEVVIDYEPRPLQMAVHKLMWGHRFGVLVCHRRFGKTVLAVNHLIREAAVRCKKPRPRLGYLAPTYTQGKSTAFDYFTHYAAAIPGRVVNQSELRVDFPTGGQTRIYGGDNPDSLRGLYFDGVVLDEYGLHGPRTFSEVVNPTLVDRGGWALFIGTPNGLNQFYEKAVEARERVAKGDPDWFFAEYKASETGLIPKEELARAASQMTPEEYAQEFECSFEAAVKGAIYAKELELARIEHRVATVPYDPSLPVDTDWDLGVLDPTSIWFSQSTRGGEIRLIDYHEASGEGLNYFATVLKSKPYHYGKHWAPHDITVRELSSGRSRIEVAAQHGIRFDIVPRLREQAGDEVEEGIHAARMILSRCYFDAVKCKAGLEALKNYRRDYNDRLREFKATPVHDWASHAADAFRGLAVRHQIPREQAKARVPKMPTSWQAM